MKPSPIRLFYWTQVFLAIMGSVALSQLQSSEMQVGELKRPNPQGPYGVIWEIDDDNLPEFDFSVLSYSWEDQMIEQKYQKTPSPDAITFLFWVHRDYESDKEKARKIEAIRDEINKKPFRVQIFGQYVMGPFIRGQTKYDGMIKLKAAIIWNSIDDFAKLCDGVMLGKSYVIEGILGIAR